MQLRTDEELVLAAQSGDRQAFEELFERHRTACFKQAMAILRDEANAEDEVQNTAWKAFLNVEQFQHGAKFSTWLSRIVMNQCLMRLRKQRRENLFYLEQTDNPDRPATLELPSVEAGPERELGRFQVAALVRRELGRIPPLLRNVFVLRDLEMLPMPAVAERLGISVPAAKSRLLRARAELRERLGKHCGRMGPATLLA